MNILKDAVCSVYVYITACSHYSKVSEFFLTCSASTGVAATAAASSREYWAPLANTGGSLASEFFLEAGGVTGLKFGMMNG